MRFENMGKQPCSIGLEQGVAVLLSYLLGFVGGIVFYIIEKQNKLVRFSAMQSIMLSALWFALMLILSILSSAPVVGIAFTILNYLLGVGLVALLVVMIVQGFQNRRVVLPIIGDLADKWSQPQDD
ncbi:MAG: hypothetical protein JRF63_00670 [Deltaproteobacteria bacterium]|nr:hypothetical protein [Deltaproteobacteria bacterium]